MSNRYARQEDGNHAPSSTLQEERSPSVATSPTTPLDPLAFKVEPEPKPELSPLIAIRTDAVILLSTEELTGCDLTGRKLWTGIELTEAEADEVRGRFLGAAAEAAAHVTGKLRKKKGGGS